MKILGDNENTLIKDPESQNQTKHINVIYHQVWKLVKDGKLAIK